MEPLAIAERIRGHFPAEVIDVASFHGQTAVLLQPNACLTILSWLRSDPELRFDHLRALCGVDNIRRGAEASARFEVVYQLYSIPLRHEIRLRFILPEKEPRIASVVSLWPGANWLERETFDFFGIIFDGHPNLTRVLLPDDWEGHPLRKEYPLKGKTEWRGLTALIEKARQLDQFSASAPQNADKSTPQSTPDTGAGA